MARPLGRRPPTDWQHVERFPLTATTLPTQPVPCVFGTGWYSSFDFPQKIGSRYYIGRHQDWGRLRGGHAICIEEAGGKDATGWWPFYDQGSEGACVGFACSRVMSHLNRERYDAIWLYHEAQKMDEWPGTDYDGTSVRAGFDVLRGIGHREVWRGKSFAPALGDGVFANRWATSVDDVLNALGRPNATAVPLLNSWGATAYPRRVWLPVEALERLLDEDGEVVVPTDR